MILAAEDRDLHASETLAEGTREESDVVGRGDRESDVEDWFASGSLLLLQFQFLFALGVARQCSSSKAKLV